MEIPHTTPMIKFLPQKLISAFIAIPRIAPRHPRPTQIIAQTLNLFQEKRIYPQYLVRFKIFIHNTADIIHFCLQIIIVFYFLF